MTTDLRSLLKQIAAEPHPSSSSQASLVRRVQKRAIAKMSLAGIGAVAMCFALVAPLVLLSRGAGERHSPAAVTSSATPAPYPSGTFAFLSAPSGSDRLRVLAEDVGSTPRALTSGGFYTSRIAWAPDGERFAIDEATSQSVGVISIFSATTGDVLGQLKAPSRPQGVAWSPNGEAIAYADESGNLMAAPITGANPYHLTDTKGFYPAWSPDGKDLAFETLGGAIDVLELASGKTTTVATVGRAGWPTWSPDSSMIAFSSFKDGGSSIDVVSAGGGQVRQLTERGGGNYDPAWSPDGLWIAFGSNADGTQNLYSVNVSNGAVVRLTSSTDIEVAPAWRPTP